MFVFDLIANKRQQVLGEKYLNSNGENKILTERDFMEDIVEEFCDIRNIGIYSKERILRHIDFLQSSSDDIIRIYNHQYDDRPRPDVYLKRKRLLHNAHKIYTLIENCINHSSILGQKCIDMSRSIIYPVDFRKEEIKRIGIDDPF
jgi:hypothetical protein